MSNSHIRLFFSYKSDDVVMVRRIAERLMADGFYIWMDEYGISDKQQEYFQKVINDAIDNTTWGILFINNRYAKSPYCLLEVERLLRKRSNNIIALILEESQIFGLLYPELCHAGFRVGYSDEAIFASLLEKQVLAKLPYPIKQNVSTGIDIWESNDALFRIDLTGWQDSVPSRFRTILGRESIKLTEERRTDYTEFFTNIDGHEIKLVLDYDIYEGSFAESIMKRLGSTEFESIRKMDYNEDDRKRREEEIKFFDKEVRNAYVRIAMLEDFHQGKIDSQNVPIPPWEFLGTHLFSTKSRGSEFKHCLFSFRIPSMQLDKKIFRVYKLVLPHPQLSFKKEVPVRIRFIFCFQDDLKAFFKTIPWCDSVVNSFEWIAEDTLETLKLE